MPIYPSKTKQAKQSYLEQRRRDALIFDVSRLSLRPDWLGIVSNLPTSPPYSSSPSILAAYSVVLNAALLPLWSEWNAAHRDCIKLSEPTAELRDDLIALGRWRDAVANPPPPPPPQLGISAPSATRETISSLIVAGIERINAASSTRRTSIVDQLPRPWLRNGSSFEMTED